MYTSIPTWLQLLTALILLFTVGPNGGEDITVGYPVNTVEHPYVCACGNEVIIPAYTEDEFEVCADCRTGAYAYEDGTYSVITYDEQGGLATMTDYLLDGSVMFEQRIESEYDDNGNVVYSKEYYDDILMYESAYLPCENPENGDFYQSEWTIYDYDGEIKYVYTYDELYRTISCVTSDLEDNVISIDLYSYEYDDEGNLTKEICTTNDVLSYEMEYKLDADGFSYTSRMTYYDEEGRLESVTEYDEYGDTINETEYDYSE